MNLNVKQVRIQFTNEEYEKIKALKIDGLALTKSIKILLLEHSNRKGFISWKPTANN